MSINEGLGSHGYSFKFPRNVSWTLNTSVSALPTYLGDLIIER